MRATPDNIGTVVLRAQRLGRDAPGKVLVSEATFEVARGETLVIVGPSGCGKSSLLRLLNRLDEPTRGTVLLDGVDYRSLAPRELRRRVGMVMQRPHLFRGTVGGNLRFGPRQRGVELPDARVDELLEGVGLRGYAGRDVATLSGGEAQRVAFARALANSPEVLLLDEPTSALDEESKRDVERVVRHVADDRGIACVLVTHDLAQASRLGRRALVMDAGAIRRSGAPEEVIDA